MTDKLIDKENQKLQKNTKGIIMMLALQFLVGMAVNLIGMPEETSGNSKLATTAFLMLHVLIGIGLLISAAMAVKASHASDAATRHLVRYGAITIGVTFVFGGLTAMTGNNWWSYLMSAGFMGSLLLYGKVLFNSRQQFNIAE